MTIDANIVRLKMARNRSIRIPTYKDLTTWVRMAIFTIWVDEMRKNSEKYPLQAVKHLVVEQLNTSGTSQHKWNISFLRRVRLIKKSH